MIDRRLGAHGTVLLVATAAAALSLYLFGAGAMPLTDPDEGRYAEISREMLASGDWLVPRLFGIPYLEKPPLLFWLTAASFRAFGTGEGAARAVTAAAAALGVALAGAFAWRRFSPRAGLWSSIVLALCGLYLVLARTVIADMLFTVGIALGLCGFGSWREQDGPWSLAAFWVGLAVATLSKGPAAVVICGVVIGIDAALARSWRHLVRRDLLLGALPYLAVTLPWFLMIQSRYPGYFEFYLWKEHLNRAAGSEHAAPFYWFVPWLLLGMMPWTPLAVVAVPDWWRRARADTGEGRTTRFLLAWAAVVFVLFSAAEGKLATYILPMFPPLAVLLGDFLDRAIRRCAPRAPLERALLATGAAFLVGFAALVAAPAFVHTAVHPALAAVLLCPMLAAGVAIVVRRAVAPVDSLAALAGGAALFYVALAGVAPALARSFTARPLIARVGARLGPADHYLLWGKYLPSAAFYLGRPPLLVGLRPELRFGASLVERTPSVFGSLRSLGRATEGGRLFVLSDDRKKRGRELREGLGEVEEVARNYVATLWVRR